MNLLDLSRRTQLTLEISWGDNRYEITTQVVGSSEDGLLIEPLQYDDKVLDFGIANRKKIIFNLYVVEPNSNIRQVWKAVDLKTVVYKGRVYYTVKTSAFNMNSTPSERRTNNRMQVDVKGVLELGKDQTGISVHVVDVSDSGISFTTDTEVEIDKMPYTLHFTDIVKEETFNLKVKCVWARRVEMDDKILWGCRISEVDRKALTYISLKKALLRAQNS